MTTDAIDIYRHQTSMLQWLRRLGHRVDFSHDPAVKEVIPFAPAPLAPPARRFDGDLCPYCSRPMIVGTKRFPSRDHIRPRRAGGTLAPNNCLIVCSPCNNDKRDMMLFEFLEWLSKRNDPRAQFVRKVYHDWR